jgi:hypothetical protein
MDQFPPGGWELANYDVFVDWAKELKLLDPSRTLAASTQLLYMLAGRLEKVNTPLELEDSSSEDEEEPDVKPAPRSVGTIKVKPVRTAPAPEAGGSGHQEDNPKVSSLIVAVMP